MDPQGLYDVTPRLDCGVCEAPTCRAFARRTLSARSALGDCPILRRAEYADRRARFAAQLEGMLRARDERGAAEELTGGVTYIRPCAEDSSKVTAETRLQRRFPVPPPLRLEVFDPSTWDWMLRSLELFQTARCSEDLGVARIEASGMTIMVFRDGRVNVRAAPDEKQAMGMIRLVSRTLWGSVICDCGNTSMDCAGGACTECHERPCPALDAEPFAFASAPPQADVEIDGLSLPCDTGSDALGDLDGSVCQAAYMLKGMAARVTQGSRCGHAFGDLGGVLPDARRKAVGMLLRSPESGHVRGALTALGALMDLQRAGDSLSCISSGEQPLLDVPRGLVTQALRVLTVSCQGLVCGRPPDAAAIQEEFDVFQDAWGTEFERSANVGALSALHRMAANGLYLSRLGGR